MRFKIIAVNAMIVLVVGILSFVIMRTALVQATSNQEVLTADAKRDVQGAAAKLQLDALRTERWLRTKAAEPATSEPFSKGAQSAKGDAATKRCNDLVNQMKSDPIFEGNVPTFAALVDANGKILGRNGTDQTRGEDVNATYPGLKATLKDGRAGSDVAVVEKTLASYVGVYDEKNQLVGAFLVGKPLNDALSHVSEATTGRALALVSPDTMEITARSATSSAAMDAPVKQASDIIKKTLSAGHADVTKSGDLLVAAAPLESLGDGKRAVLVAAAPASMIDNPTALAAPVLGATALGIVLVLIFGWLLGNYITRPIAILEEGLLAILNGQADKRFELEHAELGGLAFRIDQLLNQLMGVEEDTTDAEGRVSHAPSAAHFTDAMSVDDKRMEGEGTLDPESVARLSGEASPAYYARIYREYIAAKKALGEGTDHITEVAFATRIQGMERDAAAKYGRPVRYQVQARNKEVVLLAIPLP
jgi:hypothetical protein